MSLIEDKKVDVIITTETFARSIIDTHIGLVGVINFDSVLKTPSYDAESRAYNLLVYSKEHLIKNDGKMIVQTTHPDSKALECFITGDYKEFMKTEILNRKLMHNEPFYHINRIIIKTSYEEMFIVANNIKKVLKVLCNKLFIIGPTYSKQYGGCVLIVKHNYNKINDVYKAIYERYQTSQTMVIFDKYPRKL
jgi:primosomal protein N'